MKVSWAGARDFALALVGAGIVVHEVVIEPAPRLEVLTVAAALLGLPGTWTTDRALARKKTPPGPGPQ